MVTRARLASESGIDRSQASGRHDARRASVTRHFERGSALVFALAALTLIAITIGAVSAEIQSRGAGVVLEERAVRVTALSDAAMAETLAELAENGVAFPGVTERHFEGGAISSSVRPMGAWEVEVTAVGRRDDWRAVVTARVFVKSGARILWWQRTQGPSCRENGGLPLG